MIFANVQWRSRCYALHKVAHEHSLDTGLGVLPADSSRSILVLYTSRSRYMQEFADIRTPLFDTGQALHQDVSRVMVLRDR